MRDPLDQSILQLLLASRDDGRDIGLPVTSRSFGFHTQQAVEKLLKALIAAHGERYEFTHTLGSLVQHVVRLGESVPVPVYDVEYLTAFAGPGGITQRPSSQSLSVHA